MYPGAGQQDNETRKEYLRRLKGKISDPEYLEQALDELAVHLTRGVEKGINRSDGSATATETETAKKKK